MKKEQFLGASLHTGLCVLSDCDFDNNDFDEVVLYKSHHYNEEFEDFNEISDIQIPILRPLFDLTKPITHNGETFVPIVELAKIGDTTYDKLIISNLKFDYRFVNLDYLPVWIYRKFIEWHFNLMDESEPFIPVTEEFNPYK